MDVDYLKERLKDWTDADEVMHLMAAALGILPDDWRGYALPQVKWVFWTNNRLCNLLWGMVELLRDLGALEQDDNTMFRWNPNYDPAKFHKAYTEEVRKKA